jgi:hypothetical protein
MHACNPKNITKVFELLISKQTCMEGLKERIEEV